MEQSIKERMRDNEQLLLTLRKLSDRLRETGMGIDQLIRQNPDVIEETKGQAIRDLSDVRIYHPVTLCHGPDALLSCHRNSISLLLFWCLRATASPSGGTSINCSNTGPRT